MTVEVVRVRGGPPSGRLAISIYRHIWPATIDKARGEVRDAAQRDALLVTTAFLPTSSSRLALSAASTWVGGVMVAAWLAMSGGTASG